MGTGEWVGLVIIGLLLLWFRHLARDRTPPKPKRPRPRTQRFWWIGF